MRFAPCQRRYGWSNLKICFRQLANMSFVKAGRDSGFPPCCIAYYKVRAITMNVWVMIFGNYGFFVNPVHYTFHDEQGRKEYRRCHPSHVLCWFHKIKYWGREWTNAYHTCPKCDWQQFEDPECRRCL
jgi:hypothetical protein